jgi:hypothetical protein
MSEIYDAENLKNTFAKEDAYKRIVFGIDRAIQTEN